MFENRPNAQKPGKNLIRKFQESFSDVVRSINKSNPTIPTTNDTYLGFTTTQATPGLRSTPFRDDHLLPTHAAPQSFHNYDSSGLTPVFHGPAGDLHTPTLGRCSLTPRTLLDQFPVTPLYHPRADVSYGSLYPQYFRQEPQSAAYPPSAFVHSTFADELVGGPGRRDLTNDLDIQEQLVSQLVSPETSLAEVETPTAHNHTNFRYQVVLKTPTAMIHDPNDAPVTYLNKGQTYSLSITDLKAPPLANGLVKYRTSVRVSFEDKSQASNPTACWQLWKDICGQEPYRKYDHLRAVELVDLDQGNKGRTQLENISIDGFSIIWYADSTTEKSGCSIGVKFNILSTDFSRSKGVKGASLRLCAKTQTVPGGSELSFCHVKLFRDHGAERKMFTDVSQLKRAIEKRQKQAAETGAVSSNDSLGKRKRDDRSAVGTTDSRPDAEVLRMQSIFSSNHPVSTFCLPGENKDDPDLFPIHVVDETQPQNQVGKPTLQTLTPPSTSSSISRNQSHSSGDQPPRESHLKPEQPELNDRRGSSEYATPASNNSEVTMPPSLRTAMDVYSRPTLAKPVACLYLRFRQSGAQEDNCYTAVYLTERTTQELIAKIAQKRQISQAHRVQLFHVRPNGMKVIIDDDAVQRFPEGQDMIAEVGEVPTDEVAMDGDSVPVTVVVSLYF